MRISPGIQHCWLRISAWGSRTDKNELCRWMLRRCRRCIKPPQLAHSPSLSIHWRARRARRDRGPEIRTVPMFHLWHLVQSHASDFRRRLIAPESTLRSITLARKHFYIYTLEALRSWMPASSDLSSLIVAVEASLRLLQVYLHRSLGHIKLTFIKCYRRSSTVPLDVH